MENSAGQNPLVSIIVITYNSSKYVLETLESAKAQTYQNIELIVSDDCSNDDTVEVCSKWLDHNGERFVRTELVTAERNTGIAPNCNRGAKAAKGEWLKLIAGDDILDTLCVEKNHEFSIKNPDARIIFSQMLGFIGNLDSGSQGDIYYNERFAKMNRNQQLTQYLKGSQIGAGSIFIAKNKLGELNYFDERYPMVEDFPFYLKALLNKNRLYGLKEITVYYRRHEGNVTKNDSKSPKIFNEFFYGDLYRHYKDIHRKELLKRLMFLTLFNYWRDYYVVRFIIAHGNNAKAITPCVRIIKNLTYHSILFQIKKVKF